MHRFALDHLKMWKDKRSRKPIVLRGARQVGKSFLVGMFAQDCFDDILEVNFERRPEAADLFVDKSPARTLSFLEAMYGKRIIKGRTLLFLDEIQAAPGAFAALRYFYEEMPQLHVIAAGSLLELALSDHEFSMPVGRIEYLHLGPMTFDEFLVAGANAGLQQFVAEWTPSVEIPAAIHAELMRLARQFLVVGGMPEAVATFVATSSYEECSQVLESIVATYRDDFAKYSSRVPHRRIERVFSRTPQLVGRKFVYSHVDREERSRDLGKGLDLLCKARVVHRVPHTSANGIPLAAEESDRNFKAIFMDVGLLCRSLGLRASDIGNAEDALLVNSGAVCEQFVGQHLFYSRPLYEEPSLHCWLREQKSSNAEVDYVISIGETIIPVEVKAGKSGALKSLRLFLEEKRREFGVRLNSDMPSLTTLPPHATGTPRRGFRLLSVPLYMVCHVRRLSSTIAADANR